MSDDHKNLGSEKIKHLEMIQAVVARLSNSAFLVKGWAVTVGGAFFGFAVTQHSAALALVGLVPVAFFWSADAHFLGSERLFRKLYDAVRTGKPPIAPFDMAATGDEFVSEIETSRGAEWRMAMMRPALLVFYPGLLVLGAAIAIFERCQ